MYFLNKFQKLTKKHALVAKVFMHKDFKSEKKFEHFLF